MKLLVPIAFALSLVGCTNRTPAPQQVVCEPEIRIVEVEKKVPIVQACPDQTQIQIRCYESIIEQADKVLQCQQDLDKERENTADATRDAERWEQQYYNTPDCD